MLLRNRLTDRQLLLQKPILVHLNSCVALPPCRAWHLQAECWTWAQHTRCRRLLSSSSPSVRGTTADTKQAALPGACAKSLGSVGIGGEQPPAGFLAALGQRCATESPARQSPSWFIWRSRHSKTKFLNEEWGILWDYSLPEVRDQGFWETWWITVV